MSPADTFTPLINTGTGYQYRSAPREAVCLGIATVLHALVFLWNPNILKGSFEKPTNPLVEIGVIDEAASAPAAEPPKKMNLLDTLKDMLTKPEPVSPHIDPIAPKLAPSAPPALLRDRAMPHPILNSLKAPTPDELALAKTQAPIMQNQHFQLPNAAPVLQAKSFGGIRAKDLPFETSNETIAAPGQAVPISVGNTAARDTLKYVNPTLQNNTRTTLQSKRFLGSNSEPSGLSAAATPILAVGQSPSIPVNSAPALSNKQANSGGLINRALLGRTDSAPALRTIPSAAAQLDQQQISDNASSAHVKKSPNGFEITGKLANRTILKKVIPQYPSWAEEQGIIGTLRLYFTVTPEGQVRSNIKVTKTTGNPQLDQVGIDALTQWKFAAQPSTNDDDVQWGIITFTFSLAS